MSAEHSIQCDTSNNACDGGYIPHAFKFDVENGVVPLACKSYRDNSVRRCSQTCDNQEEITDSTKYFISGYTKVTKSNAQDTIEAIKNALTNFGSVAASFKVSLLFYLLFYPYI